MGYHKHFGNKLTKYVQRTKCVYLFLGVQLSMVEAFKRVGEFLLLPLHVVFNRSSRATFQFRPVFS